LPAYATVLVSAELPARDALISTAPPVLALMLMDSSTIVES
jgi:hypothetical protein